MELANKAPNHRLSLLLIISYHVESGRERIPPPESDPLIQVTGAQITVCPIPQHCLQMAKTPCTSALILISSQPPLYCRKMANARRQNPRPFLCLCGAGFSSLLCETGPLFSLSPDGTSFNIQNRIPYKSQKTGFFLETRRAKEYQRGRGGRAERAKEGCKWLPEGSDTHLGA